jgi:hypothetical protein
LVSTFGYQMKSYYCEQVDFNFIEHF